MIKSILFLAVSFAVESIYLDICLIIMLNWFLTVETELCSVSEKKMIIRCELL